MANPVRLQLSRRKGFSLQALSLATNGLPAVNVARPSPCGNPFTSPPDIPRSRAFEAATYRDWAVEVFGAVRLGKPELRDFRQFLQAHVSAGKDALAHRAEQLRSALPLIRGKNLACWCPLDEPCHADVLLELANSKSG